jgi:heat shock protein HspQ
MAKTFGTGADPKGLVNRGVEGSGAAQIFRPSQAVQDFVSRQARGEQQKAAQKKAEAKAKVERQKDLDKKFQDLLKIDIKGWTEPDNQRLLAQYGDIEKQAAELKAKGINPFDDNDLTMKIAKFQLDMGALQDQKKLFELANTKAYSLATNKLISEEQFQDYEQRIKTYAGLPFEERMTPENMALLDAPKVVEDPLVGLAKFEKIYAKKKKRYNKLPDGTTELIEEYDLDDIEKNLRSMKDQPWFEALVGQNDNFIKDYLDAFQVQKNIKGTPDKSFIKINSSAGSWGNKLYGAQVAKYNLGDAVDEAELLGISGNDAIEIFGLDAASKNWEQDKINVVDFEYYEKAKGKPILANTPFIKVTDENGLPVKSGGKEINLSAFPKGTVTYVPNRVYETKKPGVYYTTGQASINIFNPSTGISEAKNVNIGFIIDRTNKADFENQWNPEGVTLEDAMQKNFTVAKEKGTTSSKSTTGTSQTKPSATAPSKATITTKTGKTLTVPK